MSFLLRRLMSIAKLCQEFMTKIVSGHIFRFFQVLVLEIDDVTNIIFDGVSLLMFRVLLITLMAVYFRLGLTGFRLCAR